MCIITTVNGLNGIDLKGLKQLPINSTGVKTIEDCLQYTIVTVLGDEQLFQKIQSMTSTTIQRIEALSPNIEDGKQIFVFESMDDLTLRGAYQVPPPVYQSMASDIPAGSFLAATA